MDLERQKIEIVRQAGKPNAIKATLQIEVREEEDGLVSYCPALDLCSQGDDLAEAEKNIGEAIELFLESCVEDNTLEKVLTDCGWAMEKPARKSSGKNLAASKTLKINAAFPVQVRA